MILTVEVVPSPQVMLVLLAVEGDALAAAINGHAAADGECVRELDIPTTTEGDGVTGVVAVGLAHIGLQLAVTTTIADRQRGRRMGGQRLHRKRKPESAH